MDGTIRPEPATVAIAVAGLAMCIVTVMVTLSGSASDQDELEALVRALTVAGPIAVGLYALHRPPFERFGMLLVLSGVVWFLTTLANSDQALLYSVGRVSGWLVEPLLIYLLLVFPSGRLQGRRDHALVRAAALVVLILYLPTALLVDRYPVPAPWMSCDATCPANAFMLSGSEPAFVDAFVRPLREIVTLVIFAAVALRLGQRMRGGTSLTRRTQGPVLAAASFRFAAYFGVLLGRLADPGSGVVEVALWLVAIGVPLIALAFLVGLVRWWVFIARATQRLAARLRGHPAPEDLRAALADTFEDPALSIVYWIGNGDGHWGDADGHRIAGELIPTGRWLTEIRDGDERIAAIIHDVALRNDRAFIDTATAYALMALDNHRLSAQASSLVREVRESRARIQAAADAERRRIERDLHDGAQQRLVALRIKLELAAERTEGADRNGAAVLRGLGGDVEDALEEVRSLARGIYPPSLSDRGLVEGLRAAALRTPLPTTVLAAGVRRYSREIETAAYFCCLEALQNTAKHAQGATGSVIELSDNGALRLEVRDDGAGFDSTSITGGLGFTNMRDRLAAVGGTLAVDSSPGRGTRVAASIPLGGEAAQPLRSPGPAAASSRTPRD